MFEDLRRQYVNLAQPRLGAEVVYATDDFFADKARLIDPAEPVFVPGKYDENGKWMDGWESRRKRIPGHDWCVVRLGVPGLVAGFDLGAWGIIAGEMPGVDLEAGDPPRHAQTDHAPVVAGRPLATALPPVHPLAVFVILARNEDRLGGVDQPRLVGEEIVGRIDHLRPQPGLGEIDVMPAQIVKHADARPASAAR